MKYFLFRNSIDAKVIGRRNAGEQVLIQEKGLSDMELWKKMIDFFMLTPYDELKDKEPDFDVVIESAKQVKGAKMTDFLRFCPNLYTCPFMMSFKASEFLGSYNLGKHNYYPVFMDKDGSKQHSLNLLRLFPHGFEHIDFVRSIFKRGHEINDTLTYHRFPSQEEFESFEEMVSLQTVEIWLSDTFDQSLDIVDLDHVGLLMSERLMQAIRNEGLTGLDLFESPIINC